MLNCKENRHSLITLITFHFLERIVLAMPIEFRHLNFAHQTAPLICKLQTKYTYMDVHGLQIAVRRHHSLCLGRLLDLLGKSSKDLLDLFGRVIVHFFYAAFYCYPSIVILLWPPFYCHPSIATLLWSSMSIILLPMKVPL